MPRYAMILDYVVGVPVDETEAARYYKMSADNGNVSSMFIYSLKLKKMEKEFPLIMKKQYII